MPQDIISDKICLSCVALILTNELAYHLTNYCEGKLMKVVTDKREKYDEKVMISGIGATKFKNISL